VALVWLSFETSVSIVKLDPMRIMFDQTLDPEWPPELFDCEETLLAHIFFWVVTFVLVLKLSLVCDQWLGDWISSASPPSSNERLVTKS
jgi:hypothetical protein